MQNVLIDKPYRFIPAFRSNLVLSLIRDTQIFKWVLRRTESIHQFEVRNIDHLKESLAAGNSIIVAPNHSRTADPLVIGELARTARCPFFAMASWHLFHSSRFTSWMMRGLGAFSVYREGLDRKAVETAIKILADNLRPLLLFPEGTTSRTNDNLMELLDGVSMIARRAAKKRFARDGGKLVIHPVAIKYLMEESVEDTAPGVLEKVEKQIGWMPQNHLPLLERIRKLEFAVLAIKEHEFLGRSLETQDIDRRRQQFIDEILVPLESQWLGNRGTASPVVRVKNLRMKIMPELQSEKISRSTHDEYWRQLDRSYYAQQFGYFVPRYIESLPTHDRIRETIEKIEDALFDISSTMGKLKAVIVVDAPIDVCPQRKRGANGTDELISGIKSRLQKMLDELASESPVYETPGSTVDESASRAE